MSKSDLNTSKEIYESCSQNNLFFKEKKAVGEVVTSEESTKIMTSRPRTTSFAEGNKPPSIQNQPATGLIKVCSEYLF